MSISPSLVMRRVVSTISTNVGPSVACSRNSTPSCARPRAIAPIGSLPGRNCATRQAVPARDIRPWEGRLQPAVHERRLAAAGGADYGQKARVGQLVDHGIDLVLPTEEQMLLVLPEGPQARKG